MIKATTLFFGLFLFVILFGSSYGTAQDDFQEGHIVTNSNDTLYGKTRDSDTKGFDLGRYEKIRFKGKVEKSVLPRAISNPIKWEIPVLRVFIKVGDLDFIR